MHNIDELIKIAKRSSHKRYLTGAAIYSKSGDMISWGTAHTTATRYQTLLSLHAEAHALAKVRHLDLAGHSCYILTMSGKSKNITWGLPCLHCYLALKAANVDKIYFSTPNGTFDGPADFEYELDKLKDYSIENNCGKAAKDWTPPAWALPKRSRFKYASPL